MKKHQNINSSILDLIGNTPLIKVGEIFAKLETVNPSGSVKDRMAWYMVKKAEERKELKPKSKIIEVTSGNTGISFSMISAIRGYKFIAIMPESMSIERRKMIKAFGAEIILTPAKKDMKGAVEEYEKIIKKFTDAWLPKQFENPDNISAHREGLGKEILKEKNSKIDAFVAGVGTGGTLIGVAQALKKAYPKIKIIAVEPKESAVLSGKKPGFHKIQGIGEGFIPKIIKDNINIIDEIFTISSNEAINTMKELREKFGILAGISSGANISSARKIKKKYNFKNVVTVLPDRGERYLSKI
ncbi:MAG TPA: cysteine synthase A [Candidatus Pacearchaeota archaeon]|nr:cysteine synthase A [Candidatus Pacearchaeota archaeon]